MTTSSANLKRLAPHILIVALLLLALLPTNPYGYYSFMRWIVSGVFAFLAVSSHKQHQGAWPWAWAIAAGIYNPIFPVHATREFWSFVNVLTIGFVLYGAFMRRTMKQ